MLIKKYDTALLLTLLANVGLILHFAGYSQTVSVLSVIVFGSLALLVMFALRVSGRAWYEFDAEFHNDLIDYVMDTLPEGFEGAEHYDFILPANISYIKGGKYSELVLSLARSRKEIKVRIKPSYVDGQNLFLPVAFEVPKASAFRIPLSWFYRVSCSSVSPKVGIQSTRNNKVLVSFNVYLGKFMDETNYVQVASSKMQLDEFLTGKSATIHRVTLI